MRSRSRPAGQQSGGGEVVSRCVSTLNSEDFVVVSGRDDLEPRGAVDTFEGRQESRSSLELDFAIRNVADSGVVTPESASFGQPQDELAKAKVPRDEAGVAPDMDATPILRVEPMRFGRRQG